jgi:predicted cupin superfamily sugar epimerase
MLPRGDDARALVERLDLAPHPEGGWFRRTWTSADAGLGERASASSIQYLLDADVHSRWHRIDASEHWTHVGGAPLVLSQYSDGSGRRRDVLGHTTSPEHAVSAVVDPGVWQSACTTGDWSLAVCVVVPEFSFEGFELAPEGWEPPATTE